MKAHRLFHHSTLGLRVRKKTEEGRRYSPSGERERERQREAFHPPAHTLAGHRGVYDQVILSWGPRVPPGTLDPGSGRRRVPSDASTWARTATRRGRPPRPSSTAPPGAMASRGAASHVRPCPTVSAFPLSRRRPPGRLTLGALSPRAPPVQDLTEPRSSDECEATIRS